MGNHSYRGTYPIKVWGVGGREGDCSRSENCKQQVSSSSARSFLSSIRTCRLVDLPARTYTSMWGRHGSSCFLVLRIVSFSSRTRLFPLTRNIVRVEVLLSICSSLLALLWLFSRHWQIFQIDPLAPYTPSLSHIRDEGCEKYFKNASGVEPNEQRQFAVSRRVYTSKNSFRIPQSNRSIHSLYNQTKHSPTLRPEIEFRRWHTYTARRNSLPRTRGVWLLLSRRKYKNVSLLINGIASKHQRCQFSAAERQLATQKFSTGIHLSDTFPHVFDFSTYLLRAPATFLKKSVSSSEFNPSDLTPLSITQFPTTSPKTLKSGGEPHNLIKRKSRDDHGDEKGKLASLFDIWQQLEPLSSENKQFLVRHLTEKAVSHLMWFYEWQKENAMPLLLRSLLQQREVMKHMNGSYETGLETDFARNDKGEEHDEDDDDDDEDGDDDDDDSEVNEGDFDIEYSTSTKADFYDNNIPSKRTQANVHLGRLSVDNLDSIQRRHDGTALFSSSPAAAVDDHALTHSTNELSSSPYRRKSVEKSIDDEDIGIIGSATRTSEAREGTKHLFITPDSSTWLPELEIDQEYYLGSLSVLGNALSAIVTKDIPNITVTVDRLNRHIGTYLQLYKDAVWSLPLQQIVNATLNGGMFPPLVQLQNSSFPDFKRDVKCNPDVQVCQNFGSFLRAVGGLLRRVYHSTYPYNVHLRAEGAANLLHTLVIGQRVTPAFFSVVEQIVTVAMLETVLNATTSLIEIPVESQVFTLINAILSLIGEVYSLADMPAEEMEQMNLIRSKVRNAFYCRIFNGRLPYCEPSPLSLIPAPEVPRELVFDPLTGFVKFLYFVGFEEACNQRAGCFADLFIEGGNFDGFYFLLGVGSTGFPVYQGYRYFQHFLELTRLFFWQGLRPSVIDASQGSWAAITSIPETYYASTRGQLHPFASMASLTPPNNCSDFPPVPFGDRETNFPLCLNVSNEWVVGRVAALGNCNGFLYSHVCVFPSTVVIFPTASPVFWTAATTTSTVAPPSTGPTTPPGGGVPPGGTTGGVATPFVPSGKNEEGHFGGGSKTEYLFWEEGDSPFDTSYPWERKNLLSGWTARRRRTEQKLDRRLAGAHWGVDSPRTYLATDRNLSFRSVEHANSGSTSSHEVFLIPAANEQLLSSQMHKKQSNTDAVLVKEKFRTSRFIDRAASRRELPENRNAKQTDSARRKNSVFVSRIELLQGEAARKAVAKKLEGLNGMNGRRFQSSIPVHRSQFVDGFSGKVVTHIPPFFPIPPELL